MKAEFIPGRGIVLIFEQKLNDMAIAVHAMLAVNRATDTTTLNELIALVAAISHENVCALCDKKIDKYDTFTFYKQGIRHVDCKCNVIPFPGTHKEVVG